MKFLCLAYGREEDWAALSDEQRTEVLARDQVLVDRGALVSILGEPTVVTAWDGPVEARAGTYAQAPAPLVGFSLVEADDLDEAVRLVGGTPCSVARGAIEIRPLLSQ